MKITFDFEDGTVVTTTPEKIQLGNVEGGIALRAGGLNLLAFQGLTAREIEAENQNPKP